MDKKRIQLGGALDQVMANLRGRWEAISEALDLPDEQLVAVSDEPLHRSVRSAASGYATMLTTTDVALMPTELLHWWVLQPCRQRLADMAAFGVRMEDAALYRVALAAVLAELRLVAGQAQRT